MKKLVFVLLSFISLSAVAQPTLTVTVTDSGTAAPGVAVFYYSSPSQFFNGGNWMSPDYGNYDSWAYTNANGVVSFTLPAGVAPLDTIFWATQECSGNWVWGAGNIQSAMFPNITASMWLSCLPGACDAFTMVDYDSASASIAYNAVPLRDSSAFTSTPGAMVNEWTFANVIVNGNSGVLQLTPASPQPSTYCYKVYSNCTAICDSISYGSTGGSGGGTGGGGGTNNAVCLPWFQAFNSSGNQFSFIDSSYSNGTIIASQLDLGDGNLVNMQSFGGFYTHTYASAGTYLACLNITAVLGADTCSSFYCDTIVVGTGGGGGGGNPHSCMAGYMVDTLNSGLFQNQLIIWESSSSNGTIISYNWDFGDGTTINTQYPSHTYAVTGVYPVCLTITSVQTSAAGIVDTCISTYCDSIGFDANGNLVYKTGFTINVIDPSTVGIDELLFNESLVMYPNPAKEKVNLSWDANLDVNSISVFSISGQQVQEVPVNGASAEIAGLPSGAYLVRLQTAQASKTLRLIIE